MTFVQRLQQNKQSEKNPAHFFGLLYGRNTGRKLHCKGCRVTMKRAVCCKSNTDFILTQSTLSIEGARVVAPNAQTDPNTAVVGWWDHCWWLAENGARCWHFFLIRSHSAASSVLWESRNSPTHLKKCSGRPSKEVKGFWVESCSFTLDHFFHWNSA